MKQNKLVIEYIFTINLAGEININTIYYKLRQSWTSLTGAFPIIAFFLDRWSIMVCTVRLVTQTWSFRCIPFNAQK
jgi:hypothetical protein